MPVALDNMRPILMRGLRLTQHAGDQLRLDMIDARYFPLLHAAFDVIPLRFIGDLQKIPDLFSIPEATFERKLIFNGFEYAQGSGRLRGGSEADAAELAASAALGAPEGMIATYEWQSNGNRKALDGEIDAFLSDYLGRACQHS